MQNFSTRLKYLRKSNKYRQSDLANFLNITTRHYQDIKYGNINIPYLTLVALADFFDVSLDYLVVRTDNPEVNK